MNTQLHYNCALLSTAVYKQDPEHYLKSFTYGSHPFKDMQVINDRATDTKVLICEDETYIYVSFAGTESVSDVATALKMTCAKAGFLGIHSGFLKAWQAVCSDISGSVLNRQFANEETEKAKNVVFTGHSLGGALALVGTLAFNPHYCYTFGAPAVGDKRFVKALAEKKTSISRFVNRGDVVPYILQRFGFVAGGGTEFLINTDNLTYTTSKWDTVTRLLTRLTMRPSEVIREHRMTTYLNNAYHRITRK